VKKGLFCNQNLNSHSELDTFCMEDKSTMIPFIFINVLVFVLNKHVQGGCIYEKYFHQMLNEKHVSVAVTFCVKRIFDCEKICLERGITCVGANVIVNGGYYICSLFSEMPTTITDDQLQDNKHGKLILKTRGKLHCLINSYPYTTRI